MMTTKIKFSITSEVCGVIDWFSREYAEMKDEEIIRLLQNGDIKIQYPYGYLIVDKEKKIVGTIFRIQDSHQYGGFAIER